jgi:hypothetical protein
MNQSAMLARFPRETAADVVMPAFPDRPARAAGRAVLTAARAFCAPSPEHHDPDAQFRLRPGPAGSCTVPFESGNFPGYFLRHANNDFQLVHNDGTAQVAADATFRQVAGLAYSTWSSFQSTDGTHPIKIRAASPKSRGYFGN